METSDTSKESVDEMIGNLMSLQDERSAQFCTAESCSIPSMLQEELTPVRKQISETTIKKFEASSSLKYKNNKNRRKCKSKGENDQPVSLMQQLRTQNELNGVLQQYDTVLLEFVTTWCTACHSIQPLYDKLTQAEMEAYLEGSSSMMIQSTQVTCDRNKETKKLAGAYGIKSYPVFILFQNGKEANRWKGADFGKLEKVFDNYGANSGGGRRSTKGKKGKRKK